MMLSPRSCRLCMITMVLSVVSSTAAFVSTTTSHYHHSRVAIPVMASRDDNRHSNHHHQHPTPPTTSVESLEELDATRRKFESLFAANGDTTSLSFHSHSGTSLSHRPLSTSSRRRRQIEIDLLQSLEDSDDAAEELVMLWMTERGPEHAHVLQEMQEHCSTGLVQEEAMLRQMKRDHEDWLEVRLRLAMLLYYKGRTAESKTLCWHVLFYKPWHFEAVHLAMLLAFREGRQRDVWKWARERLPPLAPERGNAKRKEWVRKAVGRAQESLERAELELLQSQQQQSLLQSSPLRTTQESSTAEESTFC